MKRIIAIGLALIIIVIGGMYLAAHKGAPAADNAATSTASSSVTPSSGNDTGAPASSVVQVPSSGSVTLALGETASFHGFLITPTQVVQDSRCPAGVYCIQAGTVEVSLTARTPLGTFTRTAKLGDTITYGSEKLTFSEVAPLKTAKPIDPNAYRFVVTIEQI